MASIHLSTSGPQAPNDASLSVTCERVFSTVLLVEDHLESAVKTRSVLESRGLQVHLAKDGGQVHLLMQMYQPDCIVMELILPGESGFELTEWIKQKYRLPVVVLTDVDLISARQLAHRVGADAYVTQPVASETLLRVLDQVAQDVWNKKHCPDQSLDANQIQFRCRCGTLLEQPLANRGKFVTCSDCHDRVHVPLLSQNEMLCVGPEPISVEQNEQEQFWRVTMRYVTVKCQYCATYFRPFTSDRCTSKVCPKCRREQSGPLCISGAPLTQAAMASSLRVLKVLTGKHRGKQLMLPRHEVLLGKGKNCEIRRQHCGWSEEHCALRPSVKGIIVRDLGSKTGTWINGVRITQETLLPPGGTMRVGHLWFRLVCAKSSGDQADSPIILRCDETHEFTREATELGDGGTVFEFRDIATESATVIQEYWESCRQRALQKLDSRSGTRH